MRAEERGVLTSLEGAWPHVKPRDVMAKLPLYDQPKYVRPYYLTAGMEPAPRA